MGQHVGTGHAVEHLRPLVQTQVVDIFHTAQQGRVGDIAVHAQRAGTDAYDAAIAARNDLHFPADQVGDRHNIFRDRYARLLPRVFGLRFLLRAGSRCKYHSQRQQQRQDLLTLHKNLR